MIKHFINLETLFNLRKSINFFKMPESRGEKHYSKAWPYLDLNFVNKKTITLVLVLVRKKIYFLFTLKYC